MLCEPADDIETEIGALELRIGVDDDGNGDRVGDGAKIAFDLRIGKREISLENGQDAIGAELLIGSGLRHRVIGRCRGNAGHHRYSPPRGFNGRLHHHGALFAAQIGKLAGGTERRQPVNAGFDEIVAQPAEHVAADIAVGIDGRNQIGKHAMEIGMEIGHGQDQA
jgi:hypothetical protein